MHRNYKKKTPYLIIELLESFSKKELDRLGQFCISPYFNTDKFVIRLLDVLIKKVLHQSIIANEVHVRIYNKIFVDLPKVKSTLNKKQKALLNAKMSALTKLSERFLTIEALEKSKTNRCELLLSLLIEKKQYRLHKKHIKKETEALKSEFKDYEYFNFLHMIEEEKFSDLWLSGKWIIEDNLNEVMRTMDLMYLAKKLNYTLTGLAFNQNKAKKKYDQSILKMLELGVFENIGYKEHPIFVLQVANAKLLINKTEDRYKNLLILLEQYENSISIDYLSSFYNVAINFITGQIKKGDSVYFTHFLELIKKLDQKNLLLGVNKFPIQKLKIIVTTGCRLDEFDWVLTMIEKCTPHIDKSLKEDVSNYNKGYVAFQKKEYDTCIDYLLEVNNFQIRYDIEKRILLIKSYYELDKHYLEPTAQVFRSIETFILRNKLINAGDKKYQKNFLNLAYNLYRYKHRIGKMNLNKLKDKLNTAALISNKAWLQEKIEELEKRK